MTSRRPTPIPALPDSLTLKNGKKVTKASDWWSKRRPEIVEDFDREVYGRVPKNVPKVNWVVEKTENGKNGDFDIVTKTLSGDVDNSSDPDIEVKIGLILVTPANAKGPVPVMLLFSGAGFGFPVTPPIPGAAPAPAGPPYRPNGFAAARGGFAGRGPVLAGRGAGRGPQGPTPQQQILARGWGYALLNTGSIQSDSGEGLTLGIIGLVNKGQPRQADHWGVLRAWAWGASRALDYFETEKTVDAKHVALEGHSRWGKATLVAMAYDQRLWTAYVSSSGEGGAKLHRRDWGEIVENIANTSAYHWMAGNFLKYSGPLHANDLPVDSHELIAMCAPRPVFISAGKGGYDAEPGGDSWVDAKGSFLAGGGRRTRLPVARKEAHGRRGVPAHRDFGRRRRGCSVPATRRRPHRRTQLALLPGVRRDASALRASQADGIDNGNQSPLDAMRFGSSRQSLRSLQDPPNRRPAPKSPARHANASCSIRIGAFKKATLRAWTQRTSCTTFGRKQGPSAKGWRNLPKQRTSSGPRPIQSSSRTFCRREIALSKTPRGASSVRREIRAATFRS